MAQNAASRSSQSGPFVGRRKSAAVTPGEIDPSTPEDVDFTFAEAAVGDIVTVAPNTALVDGVGIIGAWVSAAGNVKVRFAAFGTNRTQTAVTLNVGLAKAL